MSTLTRFKWPLRLVSWWADLPLRWKGFVVVGMPLFALATGYVSSLIVDRQERLAEESVEHTKEVRGVLQRAVNQLLQTETELRGFVITKRPEFLDSYRHSARSVPEVINQLRRLTKDNPDQVTRIEEVEQLVAAKLKRMEGIVNDPTQAGEKTSPATTISLVLGETETGELREKFRAMDDAEEHLQKVRVVALERADAWIFGIDVAVVVLGFLGGVVAMVLFSNGVVHRAQMIAENADRSARGLPLVPIPSGNDEIGQLGQRLEEAGRLVKTQEKALRDEAERLSVEIAERKEIEQQLRRNKRQLEVALQANQLIMDNSQEVICTIDERGRFLSINPACLELWGYTPAELIGRSHVDLIHPADRPKTAEADANTRKAGRLTDFVNRYVRKDGALVDVLWSATWSEADRIFFCVAHDVTQRQLAEEALREAKDEADRANRAKSEFLSRMSHELRTPLNAILGFGQLLEQQNPTETQRSRLGHITSAGRHLLDLINEVLDISRIEAGRLQLSLEPVCVNTALAEAVDLMRPMAAERGVGLACPNTLDADTYVLADTQRLKQVLLNLLTNAIKYTGTGGDVTVCCDACACDRIRIVVTDTGAGIPEEKLPRLFTPFDRLGAEQSDVQGTGLGLALSQRLMQAMNGEIGVTSVVGEGSTFWLELPRTTSPLELSPPRSADNGVIRHYNPTAAKQTVLYIEDNSSNLILVEQILADEPDLELITATSAKAGLDFARQHIPDVILLDLHLPDLPGWNLLAQFKAEQTLRHIPVIVVSADATKRQKDRLRAAGAHAYLTKPIDVPEFRRVLRHSLGLTKGAKEPALCMT